jgi:CRP-like cAMP-binding protein
MPDRKRHPNSLVTALPEKDRKQLLTHLKQIELPMGAVLAEPHTPLKHAYFLHDSMVSLLSLTSDGATVEVAMVDSEGLIGVSALLGSLEEQKLFIMCQIFKPRQVLHFGSSFRPRD